MIDHSHLDALELHLSHERQRLARAKSAGERAQRGVWVAQLEREIAAERTHLGLGPAVEPDAMTDDELLAELGS